MGRIRSIDRRKRRPTLAGSCGSTSGRAGCWVIQATSSLLPATSAMHQAFSGAKHGLPAHVYSERCEIARIMARGGMRHTGYTGAAADAVAGIAAPRAEIGRVAAPYSAEV
jgi:hypothetical protein